MNPFTDLLFLNGHIVNPALARALASPRTKQALGPTAAPDSARDQAARVPTTPGWSLRSRSEHPFKGPMYLDGLEAPGLLSMRQSEATFGSVYGNRPVFEHAFGTPLNEAALAAPFPVAAGKQRLLDRCA
ncbi:MAG: hypothetical protein WBW61_00025 [Rhodanobacteraceae bacterium]